MRAGRIDWRLARWLAPPSVVGALVGGLLAGALPSRALLAIIGVTLLYFGVDLLRPKAQRPVVAAAPRRRSLVLPVSGSASSAGLSG